MSTAEPMFHAAVVQRGHLPVAPGGNVPRKRASQGQQKAAEGGLPSVLVSGFCGANSEHVSGFIPHGVHGSPVCV